MNRSHIALLSTVVVIAAFGVVALSQGEWLNLVPPLAAATITPSLVPTSSPERPDDGAAVPPAVESPTSVAADDLATQTATREMAVDPTHTATNALTTTLPNTSTPAPPATTSPTSAPTITALPTPSFEERTRNALRAAVYLEVADDEGWPIVSASGSIIDPRGWILTNLHVVYDQDYDMLINQEGLVRVYVLDDPGLLPEWRFMAELKDWDMSLDLALLKITSDAFGRPIRGTLRLPTVSLGDPSSQSLTMLAPLTIAGFPSIGLQTLTITEGRVAGRITGSNQLGPWIKTTAVVAPGNSGGMALNERGELVGIPTRMFSSSGSSLGYLRPVDAARRLIERNTDLLPAEQLYGTERRLLVVTDNTEGLPIHRRPQGELIESFLQPDENLLVIVPGEHHGWWPVYDSRGRYGWVREFDESGARHAQVAFRSFTPQFAVGDVAQVMYMPGASPQEQLSLSIYPGGPAGASLRPGTLVQVISPPSEIDGAIWYQVRIGLTGDEGWISESTQKGYRVLFNLPQPPPIENTTS